MSTNSYICRENEDGTYTGIYCHWDGYLANNGDILVHCYKTRKKVNTLLAQGNISYLSGKPEYCKKYGEDIGGIVVNLDDFNKQSTWIDYVYVYGLDGVWRYFVSRIKPKVELLLLKPDVKKELARLKRKQAEWDKKHKNDEPVIDDGSYDTWGDD